jgi:hypothetical protein
MTDCCDTNLPADSFEPTDTTFVVGPDYGEANLFLDPPSVVVEPTFTDTGAVDSGHPALDALPSAEDYGLQADPYDYILDMAHSAPQLDAPVNLLGPNAPSLATIDNHMDATDQNLMDANPGYSTGVDPSTGEVANYAPGDMTPTLP